MLRKENYNLLLVASGRELLDKLPELNPDLVILDVMMPEMDGFEVCRKIKKNIKFQHIPIILITSRNGKEIVAQGLETGADDFLQKPINELELRARVRSMLRIKRQYNELEATLKMREELSNMIVHDMSSPIVSVLLHATLMEEKVTHPELLKHLEMIRLAADRLDSFINDILMVAKMEEKKLLLHLTPVDVNQLILDVEKHFSIIAQSKGIRLVVKLPALPLQMPLDSNLFRRIVANLLANALQYSPGDTTVTLTLETKYRDHLPHLRMQVIDQGHGIPVEYRERIFEKFGVVDLKRKGISQIGLGLTFCKMAVDAHGGKIFVEPNDPQGSIFVIEI
jgi:signal transduction histidine kinase